MVSEITMTYTRTNVFSMFLYKIYINEAHSFIKPTIIEYWNRKGQIRAISLTVEDQNWDNLNQGPIVPFLLI